MTRTFPAYSYVPGKFPHPLRDPLGHSHGREEAACAPSELEDWRSCRAYLRGLQLFNRGYYWESHESWEAAWIAAGRTGVVADFLKGLIKLAAAAVKAREGRPEGVRRHARRAAELIEQVQRYVAPQRSFFGLNLADCLAHACWLEDHATDVLDDSDEPLVVVLPFTLEPSLENETPGD